MKETGQTNLEIPHEKPVVEESHDKVESEKRSTHEMNYPNGTK